MKAKVLENIVKGKDELLEAIKKLVLEIDLLCRKAIQTGNMLYCSRNMDNINKVIALFGIAEKDRKKIKR